MNFEQNIYICISFPILFQSLIFFSQFSLFIFKIKSNISHVICCLITHFGHNALFFPYIYIISKKKIYYLLLKITHFRQNVLFFFSYIKKEN